MYIVDLHNFINYKTPNQTKIYFLYTNVYKCIQIRKN